MSKREGGFLRKNLGFLLGACARYDRKAFGLFAMYTVGCALLPFVSVFLPKVMVAGLETGGALQPLLLWAATRSCASTPSSASSPAACPA